jgi:hypothetical protein
MSKEIITLNGEGVMAIHTVVPEPEPRSMYLDERQATNQKE